MNQAEQLWWDEFWAKVEAYRRNQYEAYHELAEFVAEALDHDAFKHIKR